MYTSVCQGNNEKKECSIDLTSVHPGTLGEKKGGRVMTVAMAMLILQITLSWEGAGVIIRSCLEALDIEGSRRGKE